MLAQLLELRARAAPLRRLDGRLAAALGAQVDLARGARARARAVAAALDAQAVHRARAAVGRPATGQARVGAHALLTRGAPHPASHSHCHVTGGDAPCQPVGTRARSPWWRWLAHSAQSWPSR